MSNQSNSTSSGIGVLGLLGIVFVVLKLFGVTDVATWPWWLVTLPLWGGAALVLAIVALIFLGACAFDLINRLRK